MPPTRWTLIYFRGVALANAGRSEEALEPLRACLRLHPEYGEAHNALGMTLGKLCQYQEAQVHIVRAARLGHRQAAETMHNLGMDYCRECHRPVYRTAPAQADVNVVAPTVGMECMACHEVFCVPCLRRRGFDHQPTLPPMWRRAHADGGFENR